jgi:hypothetical protein
MGICGDADSPFTGGDEIPDDYHGALMLMLLRECSAPGCVPHEVRPAGGADGQVGRSTLG